MQLALFDFDGTITNQDMYTKFILYSATPTRLLLGGLFFSPLYLLHKFGLIPGRYLLPLVSYCAFVGRSDKSVALLGQRYAADIIPKYIRPEVIATLEQLQSDGVEITLVSASLDIYLKPWCQQLGIDLICSEMKLKAGRHTGSYLSGDCSCEAKAEKVKRKYPIHDYQKVYAFGDTHEDLAMLALADEAYMNGHRVT